MKRQLLKYFFKTAFNTLQDLIKERKIKAGHDIGVVV
jgi:hypothetical protein